MHRAAVHRLICNIVVLAPTMLWGCAAQDLGLELEQPGDRQLVRSLVHEQRDREAIAYAESCLATEASRSARFHLMLSLVELNRTAGNRHVAISWLESAGPLAESDQDRSRLTGMREELMSFEQPPAVADTHAVKAAIGPPPDTVRLEQATEEPRVTNSFFEADLRQVLTDLSMEAGIPIVWDHTVEGLVTFEAVDQPLSQVLTALLYPAGFTFNLVSGTYYVGSSSPTDPAFALLSMTEVVTLSNIEAADAIKMLSDFFKPYVKASAANNAVCISAPQAALRRIREDLKLLDRPAPQIQIEVVVTEISSSALRKLGLDWSMTGTRSDPKWSLGTEHTDIKNPSVIGNYAKRGVDISNNKFDFVASLEALVESGDAQIRANPRLTTLNGHTAKIGLTRDQYFIIATTTSQYTQYNTLQSVTSGITLEITPFASDAGEITVHVKPEVGDVAGEGMNNLPEISRRSASTSVRVMDGETFTIGGLTVEQEKKVQRKVPLLGDIPILGMLFRYDERQQKESQIVIFITPTLLRD